MGLRVGRKVIVRNNGFRSDQSVYVATETI